MILTASQLHQLIDDGVIDAPHENVNAASIDIRVGRKWLVEQIPPFENYPVHLARKQSPHFSEVICDDFRLFPGQFALAHSLETFNLPDDLSCGLRLKSTPARCGLDHILAGWCDPGWTGSQFTFAFKNQTQYHVHVFEYGLKVAQMIFWRGDKVPEECSYRAKGSYNNSDGVVKAGG